MKIISALIIFAALSLEIGCMKPSGPSKDIKAEVSAKQGGQDGGGGNSPLATSAEVKASISQIWQLLTEPKRGANFFYGEMQESIRKATERDIGGDKAGLKRLAEVAQRTFEGGKSGTSEQIYFASDYLILSPLEIKENGSCAVSDNQHADASVSKFEYGATVCISIENLQRMPKTAVKMEILGLIVHEMAHLSGYGEDDAKLLQSAVLSRSSIFFSKQYPILVIEHLDAAFHDLDQRFDALIRLVVKTPTDVKLTRDIQFLFDSIDEMSSRFGYEQISVIGLEPVVPNSYWTFAGSFTKAKEKCTTISEQAAARNPFSFTRSDLLAISLEIQKSKNAFREYVKANFPETIEILTVSTEGNPEYQKSIENLPEQETPSLANEQAVLK